MFISFEHYYYTLYLIVYPKVENIRNLSVK